MALPRAVVIHGLPHARLTLQWGRPVTLLSVPGAPSYAGCGWWRALVAAARAEFPDMNPPDALDCADAPGRGLEALACGCRIIILTPGPAFADIAERATSQGAILLDAAPPALDMADPRAVRQLEGWLAG